LSERDPRVEAEVLVRKAEDDANAMRLLADAEVSDEIVGFHAQQAVEKWLKAVLGLGESSSSTRTTCVV
jgi:HEPN domain-containing protein